MKVLYSLLLAVLLFLPAKLNSQVIINEIMAANTITLADEFGGHPDWIEIKNLTADPVNIGGWYITDSIPNLILHMIPVTQPDSTTIPGYGYLVLFADSKKSQGVRHVNFKLSKTGEQLALSRLLTGKLTLVDSVTFKEQVSDISLGRERGTNKWIYMNQPTPGQANLPLGISSHTGASVIKAWPNPCTGSTTITASVNENATARLFDLTGRMVLTRNWRADELKAGIQLNLEGQPSGVYQLLLNTDSVSSRITLIVQ